MTPPFEHINPAIVQQVLPRREALRKLGQAGLGTAIATTSVLGIVNSALARTGTALSTGSVVDVLNFALTLEYLEASFYNQGLAAAGLIPAADQPVFDQISKHEDAHVETLRATISAIGGTPVMFTDDDFDFTGGDGSGAGPFAPFSDYETFLALSQGFEDTGVRAYKGQAANLISAGQILTAALQIHSVEARHASEVRRMRGLQGWIPFEETGLPAGFEAIYAGEANTVHGGIDVTAVSSVDAEAITEAFDEPLTMEEVLAIADPFIDG